MKGIIDKFNKAYAKIIAESDGWEPEARSDSDNWNEKADWDPTPTTLAAIYQDRAANAGDVYYIAMKVPTGTETEWGIGLDGCNFINKQDRPIDVFMLFCNTESDMPEFSATAACCKGSATEDPEWFDLTDYTDDATATNKFIQENGIDQDYTQFRPRSHYTNSSFLKTYFMATKWLMRERFYI